MKTHLAVATAFLFAAVGFGVGYWYHASRPTFKAEMEDYALTNVLGVLGYANYLKEGKIEELRDLLDVNLNDHLTRVRRYEGNISNNEFMEAKIRTLNAAALLWEERPPFKNQHWKPTASNESWLGEWNEMTEKNIQLLEWAQKQCNDIPSIKCKTPNKPSEPTR
jgi:hypothetical protein